jgi:hypothetical protein
MSTYVLYWVEAILLTIFIAYYSYKVLAHDSKRLPLPPGPKRRFLVGNLFDWPTDNKEWETFAKWGARFGMYLLRVQAR